MTSLRQLRELSSPQADGSQTVPVIGVAGETGSERLDELAVEEPLAIRITSGPLRERNRATVSVTMRTPGADEDLAVGLLFAEGVVARPEHVVGVTADADHNGVRVDLHPEWPVDLARLDRRGYTASSCGVCGKTSIEAIESAIESPIHGDARVSPAIIHALPDTLRQAQPTFLRTGGLHAAALFDLSGRMLALREDVGRHNAVDKLIGAEFRAGRVPLGDRILLVSGRASFELIQKAVAGGVPIFAAVGAPSSLAVQLADRLGVTLLGFVRDGRFNIYSGAERIAR
jgi:FdhD protein